MLGFDWDNDSGRFNPDVHYRLYYSHTERGGGAVVICVQDSDYNDYDRGCFIGSQSWKNERDAEAALEKLKEDAVKILGGKRVVTYEY